MELFRGYVPTKNKKCLMPFKDVPSDELHTWPDTRPFPPGFRCLWRFPLVCRGLL